MNANADRLQLPGLIISPQWLAGRLNHPDLRLLDVRAEESYAEGHLPGAVRVELASLGAERDGVEGMLLPLQRLAAALGALGIGQERTVVIYDSNWGLPAARVLWALSRYGHENVAVLNGGIDRWQEEGFPLSSAAIRPRPASFDPQPAGEHLATGEWVQEHLDDPQVVLLDTRTPGEFAAGHLPGALCWDWVNAVPLGSWNVLRPKAALRAELARLGVTPEKEVVTYCRSGARAAHTYLVLRHLGFARVRLYDGSWLEWSRYFQKD